MNRIVDLAGKPITNESAGIVAPNGSAVSTSNGKKPRVGIKGLFVSAICSDGNLRQVTLDKREARKLTRFLLRLQGGALQLQMTPVFLMMRKDVKADTAHVPGGGGQRDGA